MPQEIYQYHPPRSISFRMAFLTWVFDPTYFKDQFGVEGRVVLLAFAIAE
jgi:hypothetical protein